jgi:hypothetical protein
MLDGVAKMGHIPTMRAGDTGVGFTLESLLGLRANVRAEADFEGIELKATRSRLPASRRPPPSGVVTLFAKTPEWHPVGSRERLLDLHGYRDGNGRWSLYTSIYARRPNPQGWQLEFNPSSRRLVAHRHGAPQVYWPESVLAARLREKHTETIFVTAHAITQGETELFRYDHVVHCKDASISNFIDLINERAAFHDFAMHRRPDGTARDHGFLFRMGKGHLTRLFATVEERVL